MLSARQTSTSELLRWMRTHGHYARGVEDAAMALGKAGQQRRSSGSCSAWSLAMIDNGRWEVVADLRRCWGRSRSASTTRSSWRCGGRGRCSRGCRRSAARRARSASPPPTPPPRSRWRRRWSGSTRRWRRAFLVALALSLGRPYLGMHYPSDVLAGALLGVVLGLIVPLSSEALR